MTPQKHKKRKAREREITRKRLAISRRRWYADNFPRFQLENAETAEPGFVRLIQRAVKSLDFRDRSLFTEDQQRFYRLARRHGNVINRMALSAIADRPGMAAAYACQLGDAVFKGIDKDELCRWVPFNDVQLISDGPLVHVRFRSLHRRSGSKGTVYFSTHRPTLLIDGRPKTVAFSRHAIEQTCHRLHYDWLTYAGLGEVFAFFDQCLYFERSDLTTRQLAFTFYASCDPGFISDLYVRRVLGEDVQNDGHYYYRVGYCPAEVEGDFVKAVTLLRPGYSGTPECQMLWRSTLPSATRQGLIDEAKRSTSKDILTSGDFRLVKMFHDGGVPQVIRSERPMYAPPDAQPARVA